MTLSAITRHGKWSESGKTSSLAEKDETDSWLGSSCQHNTDNTDLPNDVWIQRTFYWNLKCYFRPSFQVVNLCLNIGLNCYCNVSLQFLLDWYLVSNIKELQRSNNGEPLILIILGWLEMEREGNDKWKMSIAAAIWILRDLSRAALSRVTCCVT